jgi:hypothetical protein
LAAGEANAVSEKAGIAVEMSGNGMAMWGTGRKGVIAVSAFLFL